MAWAIEQQEITDPGTRHILLCLCNYADAMGANAFPAISRLCRDSGMSESSVRRHLAALVKASVIRKGNQGIAAAHIARADRRPTVYDIVTGRGVTMSPREVNGVSKKVERGVKSMLTGCQALTPDPKRSVIKPSEERTVLQTGEEAEKNRQVLREIAKRLSGRHP